MSQAKSNSNATVQRYVDRGSATATPVIVSAVRQLPPAVPSLESHRGTRPMLQAWQVDLAMRRRMAVLTDRELSYIAGMGSM